MKLSREQISMYHENGYLYAKNVFTSEEVDLIKFEMVKVIQEDCPRRILEKSGSVRSFFAPDFSNELFRRLVRINRLVETSELLIGNAVHIYQTKLNIKQAMIGDWWEWHQDYTYWKLDDGMLRDNVVTAMIFLDDVNEFNGPLLLIPGSHKAGVVDEAEHRGDRMEAESREFKEYQNSKSYMSALTANLKYTLTQDMIAYWMTKKGLYSAKGPAGSVLFFHGNVFHASSNNLSPWNRSTFLVTYNNVENILPPSANPRPEFLARRDFSPVKAIEDGALIECIHGWELVDKLS